MINEKSTNSIPSVVNYYALTIIIIPIAILSVPWSFLISKSWFSTFIILSIVMGIPLFIIIYLSNKHTFFYVDDGKITIESGIISKKSKTIPINSIQNVNIESGILMRMFGVAKIKIWTASQSQIITNKNGTSVKPDGLLILPAEDSKWLDDYLTKRK